MDGQRVNATIDNAAYDGNYSNIVVGKDEIKIRVQEEATEEHDFEEYNTFQIWLISKQKSSSQWVAAHRKVIWTFTGILLILAYFGYFGYAMYYSFWAPTQPCSSTGAARTGQQWRHLWRHYNKQRHVFSENMYGGGIAKQRLRFGDEGSLRLLAYTTFAVILYVWVKLYGIYNARIGQWWKTSYLKRHSIARSRLSSLIKWCLRISVTVGIIVYVVYDIVLEHPGNLLSVAGLALYILIFYVTSVHPEKVNWHTVFWGIALQYLFALLILRTSWGYRIFEWLGERITSFMNYTTTGIVFVFGDSYEDHFFAMKVMPIAVFFYTIINILYYLGVIQAVIQVLGRFLAFCMGTTPLESLNSAANIFLGLLDGPIMLRPFLKDMTNSEIHSIMTSGFATIAGSVLGAYISFGVPANHLISASVMSAPAALAISKLSYPETEKTTQKISDFSKMEKAPENNIIEAASNGATASIKIIGAITTNVLAFLSLLAFFNASLTWFGNRVGIEDLTFEMICSYVLFPVSYFMGVETGDCRKVAELVGVKTFTNEFIAYSQLKDLIANRHALENYTDYFNTTDWYWEKKDIMLNITGEVLKGGVISLKSEIISTYALCGFANFGSIGITLGGLASLVPSKKSEISAMVLRAMICGNVACFLTACVAGLFYKPF